MAPTLSKSITDIWLYLLKVPCDLVNFRISQHVLWATETNIFIIAGLASNFKISEGNIMLLKELVRLVF